MESNRTRKVLYFCFHLRCKYILMLIYKWAKISISPVASIGFVQPDIVTIVTRSFRPFVASLAMTETLSAASVSNSSREISDMGAFANMDKAPLFCTLHIWLIFVVFTLSSAAEMAFVVCGVADDFVAERAVVTVSTGDIVTVASEIIEFCCSRSCCCSSCCCCSWCWWLADVIIALVSVIAGMHADSLALDIIILVAELSPVWPGPVPAITEGIRPRWWRGR